MKNKDEMQKKKENRRATVVSEKSAATVSTVFFSVLLISKEAGLKFDGGCSLHSWLGLPGCCFGPAAGLIGPYSRFQTSLKLGCCADDYLEGSWIEGADVH